MSEFRSGNVDHTVAEGFGREWSTFRQDDKLTAAQREKIYQSYFHIFPWDTLPADGGVGADIGCGSGRWAAMVAPRVAHLHTVDASADALAVARQNLRDLPNVSFHCADVGNLPLAARSLDFAYSLGVLHHVPDTLAGIKAVASKLKPGAPFLIYLYYALENRPRWYRALWAMSDRIRRVIFGLPHPARLAASQIIATLVYWPLARGAWIVETAGISPRHLPLAWYRDKSFYVMQTDAYDRFCTKIEKRFTKEDISRMLSTAGFGKITFSDDEPFWCAVCVRK
jgi:ubiquinone/menaquinone biosynthesis C-methylase UbiE